MPQLGTISRPLSLAGRVRERLTSFGASAALPAEKHDGARGKRVKKFLLVLRRPDNASLSLSMLRFVDGRRRPTFLSGCFLYSRLRVSLRAIGIGGSA